MHHGNSGFRRARDSAGRKRKPKFKPGRKFGAKKRSLQTGIQGELEVAELLPMLRLVKGKQGWDLIYIAPFKKIFFFEVKTTRGTITTPKGDLKNHILLTTKNGQWTNTKAHYIVFNTEDSCFIGKASEIRIYVKSMFEQLVKRDSDEKRKIANACVSIKDLEKKHLIARFAKNKKDARMAFRLFMDEEHKNAVEQEQLRAKEQAMVLARLNRNGMIQDKQFRRIVDRQVLSRRQQNHIRLPIKQP